MIAYRFAAVDGGLLMEYKYLMEEDPKRFNSAVDEKYSLTHTDFMEFKKALRKV